MANYVIEIYRINVDSAVFERIDIIETFQGLTFFNKLNGIGAARFSLDIKDPKATRDNLTRYRNQVVIKRNDVIEWFGPITNVSFEIRDVKGSYSIECNTYMYHLVDRYTDKLKIYNSNLQQSALVWDLINTTQNRTNGTLLITQGNNPTHTTKNDTFERKSIAYAIMDLSDNLSGFDFDFSAEVDSGNKLSSVSFNYQYPRLGSIRNDLPPIRLGENIYAFKGKTKDTIYNQGYSEGAGTGENVITSDLSFGASQQAYTRREILRPEKDITLPSTLSAKLNAYLTQTSVEKFDIDISLKDGTQPSFGDYSLGDFLILDIELGGYLDLNQYARVNEISVDVGNEGDETITPKINLVY